MFKFRELNLFDEELISNPYQVLGGVIIEKALEVGGAPKVLKLFEYKSMEEIFLKEFSTPQADIGDFLKAILEEK